MSTAVEFNDLKTFAGRLLYRQLPEEYRFLDRPAPDRFGDLEAYLHGFGHLLDLIRGTIEQGYADGFAEPADNGRDIQTWLLPYLAELVGAELLAPDPEARREELNNAVLWYKTKGSLLGVDSVADVISGADTVLVEGWRRVAITPRLSLPPFTGPAGAAGDGTPAGPPAWPLGTPDLRYCNRAVLDETGTNPLYRRVIPQRDDDGYRTDPLIEYWKPRSYRGAPCLPGAYDDHSVRTPDLRAPAHGVGGPHPRRTTIYVRPPEGFFEPKIHPVTLASPDALGLSGDPAETQILGPGDILDALNDSLEVAPDRIQVFGSLSIPAGARVEIHDVLFDGTITVGAGAELTLRRVAARTIDLPAMDDAPALDAQDCLFGTIISSSGFAQLVYCTVLGESEATPGEITLSRLHASDCIFAIPITGIDCTVAESCVRYSRVADLSALTGCLADKIPSNTTDDPNFIQLYFRDGSDCVLRPAEFGEPGAGVLDLTTSVAIREGAEDDGEMGAYHHMFHAAQIRALETKLGAFSPFGQDIAITYDPHLVRPPVREE